MAPCSDSGKDTSIRHMSGSAFLSCPEADCILLDVRPHYELCRLFDVPNLVYLPYPELPGRWRELPVKGKIVIADAVGLRSIEAARFLVEHGFPDVSVLTGGIVEWDRDGLPVTTDRGRLLTGSCMCQLKVR